jgi:hypothetical protein
MLKNQVKETSSQDNGKIKNKTSISKIDLVPLNNFIHEEICKNIQEIRITSWVNSLCMMLSYQKKNMQGIFFALKTHILIEQYIDHESKNCVRRAYANWNSWLVEQNDINQLPESEMTRLYEKHVKSFIHSARKIVNDELRNSLKSEYDLSRIYPKLFFKKEESIKQNFQRILLDFHPKAKDFKFKPY